MRGRGSSRRRSPIAGALAIALLVLAQLVAHLHAAQAPHVRCAEHGELVDAASIETHRAGDARLVGVTAGHAAEDHHCSILTGHRHGDARTVHAPALAAVAAPAELVAPSPVPPVVPTTVLVLAPKTSPPDRPGSIS